MKYIVRTNNAGVFFGEIKARNEHEVTMTNVRKIYYWEGACAVEQIAKDGVDPKNSKLTVPIDEMIIAEPIQIIPCTEKSEKCLNGVKEWKI